MHLRRRIKGSIIPARGSFKHYGICARAFRIERIAYAKVKTHGIVFALELHRGLAIKPVLAHAVPRHFHNHVRVRPNRRAFGRAERRVGIP